MNQERRKIAALVVIEGEGKGQIFHIGVGKTTLGRSRSDILITDPRLSRIHAELNYDSLNGKLLIEDLQSLNGVYVNGERVDRSQLKDGDRLQLGNTVFDCLVDTSSVQKISDMLAQNEPKTPSTVRAPRYGDNDEVTSIGYRPSPLPGYPWIKSFRTGVIILVAFVAWKFFLRENSLQQVTVAQDANISTQPTTSPETSLPSELKELLTEVRSLEAKEDLEKAMTLIQSVQSKFPKHSAPYMVHGDLLYKTGKWQLAETEYEKAIRLFPPQPLAYTQLVRIAVINQNPPARINMRMQELEAQINSSPSKELFIDALDLFVHMPQVNFDVTKQLVLTGALQNKFDPGGIRGYLFEAQILLTNQNISAAESVLKKAEAIDRKNEWVLEQLAYVTMKLERDDESQTYLNRWIAAYPGSARAMLLMAYFQFNKRNFLDAKTFAEKTIQNDGASDGTQTLEGKYILGLSLEQMGEQRKAASYFNEACQDGHKQSCQKTNPKRDLPTQF